MKATPPLAEQLTQNVRLLMVLRKATNADLAEVFDIHSAAVSNKINGQRGWTIEDIEKLATHFGFPPHVLLLPAALFIEAFSNASTERAS